MLWPNLLSGPLTTFPPSRSRPAVPTSADLTSASEPAQWLLRHPEPSPYLEQIKLPLFSPARRSRFRTRRHITCGGHDLCVGRGVLRRRSHPLAFDLCTRATKAALVPPPSVSSRVAAPASTVRARCEIHLNRSRLQNRLVSHSSSHSSRKHHAQDIYEAPRSYPAIPEPHRIVAVCDADGHIKMCCPPASVPMGPHFATRVSGFCHPAE